MLEYTTSGFLTKVTLPEGLVTESLNFNGRGQPGTVIGPDGVATTLTYNPRGWLTSREKAGATWSYDYFAHGLIKSVSSPDGSSVSFDRGRRGPAAERRAPFHARDERRRGEQEDDRDPAVGGGARLPELGLPRLLVGELERERGVLPGLLLELGHPLLVARRAGPRGAVAPAEHRDAREHDQARRRADAQRGEPRPRRRPGSRVARGIDDPAHVGAPPGDAVSSPATVGAIGAVLGQEA